MDPHPEYNGKLSHILRAAAFVFAEHGYDGSSIRDISAATGISLAGLYHYVRSKEHLLFLVQDRFLDELLGQLEKDLRTVSDPLERLRLVIRNHLRFFRLRPNEMRVLVRESSTLTGELLERLLARQRHYHELLTEILGELRVGSGPHLRTAAFALFGIMNWLHSWPSEDRALSPEELEREVLQLFLHGFLAPASAGAGAAAQAERPVPEAESPEPEAERPEPEAERPEPEAELPGPEGVASHSTGRSG